MKATQGYFRPIAAFRGVVLFALVWTVLVLASLLTQREQLNRTAAELARIAAIANLKKDIAIREWASSVGGIFIREDKVPALNTLEQERRFSATDRSGERRDLVLVTPMHLLLVIQGMSNRQSEFKERLTSGQLRNRENVPDTWERNALKELEKGGSIITESLPKRGGHGLMRVMMPMRMEKECLECHRDTLIPVGGLRGGASIAIDLDAYRAAQEPTWRTIQYWHGAIWLLGLTTIGLLHIVARRRTHELLREDQARRENAMAFAAMAEGAAITDTDGTILWVNDAFCHITGYGHNEVIGANPRILKSGRHDTTFYKQLWAQLHNEGRWRGEIWNKRKTGEIYPEEISIQAACLADGSVRRYISIFSDISLRKKNEEALAAYREHLEELVRQLRHSERALRDSQARLRELALFLQDVRENERTSIARELHDELGQALTALRIDLGWLRKHCATAAPDVHNFCARLDASHALVEHSIKSLRRISEGLRPGMLDVLGLCAALEHFTRQFAERCAITCTFQTDRDEYALNADQSIAVFRLVQEALTNVSRHAHAHRVDIQIKETDGRLHLVIQDDGVGFDPHATRTGFGLLGMSERVSMLGGEMEVDGKVDGNRGTRIAVSLPLTLPANLSNRST